VSWDEEEDRWRQSARDFHADEQAESQSGLSQTSDLLNAIYEFTERFIAYPSGAAHVARVLWLAHAHLMDAWVSTPRLPFLSAEPSSGKTRVLEISELLVLTAVEAINVAPAYLFRKVGDDESPPGGNCARVPRAARAQRIQRL
jgi:hypothetical protein